MTYLEFAQMVARINTEEELEALECEDISSDCIETLDRIIEMARELTGIAAPVIEELRDSLDDPEPYQIRHDMLGFYILSPEEAEHEDAGNPSAGFDGRDHWSTMELAKEALAEIMGS